MIISAARALIGNEVRTSVAITIENNYITSIGEHTGQSDYHHNGTLIPGFVDMHCHGGGGSTFSTTDPAEIEKVIATHRSHGTTTQVASLVTQSLETLKSQIKTLKPFVSRGDLAGIHLEGPYLSHEKCGAHDPKLLRTPSVVEVQELLDLAEGSIVMVTIAPELPNAIEVIELLVSRGVVAAMGHTNANYEQAQAAIAAGATAVTHFYNAMPPLDHKVSNLTSAVLLEQSLTLELILDGHHVNKPAVEILIKSAPQRVALVTDAMAAAGNGDGDYAIGDLAVVVKEGVARLASNGSLAGSTLTMDAAFKRLVEDQGLSIADASFATSTLAAKTLGFEFVGEIAIGKLAHFYEVTL